LVSAATAAVYEAWRAGFNYAKAGVVLSDLRSSAVQQGELDLFSEPQQRQGRDRARLMEAMDNLNRKYGRDSLRIGSQTIASSGASTRSWATKQERRTPRYTTRWEEMAGVRC
jgi:DNA polymerase V